jgi:hypothetical protein
MSKILLSSAIFASVLALPIASAIAPNALANKDDFMVRNNSNANIVELYVSSSSRTTWDNNILEQGAVLRAGESMRVVFDDPSPSNCTYDILGVFANGQRVEDFQIDVCNNDSYTFSGQ